MGTLTTEELLEKVRLAFKSAFDIDPRSITIDTVSTEISRWDSMGHVTLMTSLERTFGLTFDIDELMEMENVKEISRVVQSKLERIRGALIQ